MPKTFAKTYNLLSLLGTGGMSEVYLAQDIKTGIKVAIKILDRKLSKNEEYIKRFKREVEISKTLSHPNIVKIISYGTDKGRYYIVYEYLEGLTLDRYIKSKKLQIDEIEDITLQILNGLSYAHSKNIIHRDIKPSNIMISGNGKIKILDFGIARASSRSTITKTGMFMGSPHYISPEQADSKKLDYRTDIYSFGVVIYELLTGKVPFDANTPWGIVHKHIYDRPPNISKVSKNIPSYLSKIVTRCLSKKPSDRYLSVSEIISIIKSSEAKDQTVIKSIREVRDDKVIKKRIPLSRKLATVLPIVVIVIAAAVSVIFYYINLNHTPEITAISLSPQEPTTLNDITLSYDFFDQDNGKNSSNIKWYINGNHIDDCDDKLSIPSDIISKSDEVFVEVIPYNSKENGEAIKSQVITVINSPPTISNINITPEEPTNRDNMSLSYDYYDPDEDQNNTFVKWYVNGEHLRELDNTIEVDSSYLYGDDIWYSELIPNDGEDYGNSIRTNEIIINKIVNPIIVANLDTVGAQDIFLKGNNAYVIDRISSIKVIDISEKDNPDMINQISIEAQNIFIEDEYAYISSFRDGFLILDLGDEMNPKKIGKCDIKYDLRGLFIQGGFAYVTQQNVGEKEGNLHIIDIGNKSDPKKISTCNLPIEAFDVWIVGNYAYVAYGGYNPPGGLYIIDISNKNNPIILSNIEIDNGASAVVVKDNYAYITFFAHTLLIIDISNKENPKIVNDFSTHPFQAADIFIQENYAYIAGGWKGFLVIDISDIINLEIVGSVDTSDYANAVFINNNFAYIADDRNGLQIIKIFEE